MKIEILLKFKYRFNEFINYFFLLPNIINYSDAGKKSNCKYNPVQAFQISIKQCFNWILESVKYALQSTSVSKFRKHNNNLNVLNAFDKF